MKKIAILLLICANQLYAQSPKPARYNLSAMLKQQRLKAVNRIAQSLADDKKNGVYLSAQPGDGVAWLDGVNFSNGVIELDIRGKNQDQLSFLGIAFHGIDLHTLDAIYFRPFNFLSADTVRRGHSVQYVSHPTYTWSVLREKFPGQYENPIKDAPNPDNWFHVRIVVAYPAISVFVNQQFNPVLVVKQLNERRNGKIGLWVGNNSDGAFANLTIKTLEGRSK